MRQTDRLQLKYRGMFVLAGGHTVLKTMNDIHKLSYMYIVHVPRFVFIILWYHWCEQLFAYLHCIIWSEQGHIFYILSLLCSDDAVIRFDIVWRKKKPHLSIQAWVRVMFVSVCKYHPLVLSLSLFLTCDISLSYMEKQRKDKKNIFFFFFRKKLKRSCYLVPFVKPCWLCDMAERERRCTASRLKGWGTIFVTECTQREWRDELRGHRFILSECKQKRIKIIKSIFVKLKCKYLHLQELECWSYLLSRHGILLYVIYMQFIILWFIFIL